MAERTSAAEVVDLGSPSETASRVSEAPTEAPTSSGSSLDGPSGDLKQDIEDCLNEVDCVGSFAVFGRLDTIVDPQICLVDGEATVPINLPLSEEHAQAIIRASHQAPFGKGSETIVDTSVRKTWELNSEQFRIRNPQWPQFIERIVNLAADELGISRDAPVGGELYKMLLYEKGAMFKAHTDTEKVPGMFGTLVICLPSKHEGGAVIARHRKQTKVFRSENFEQSFISWYSDVKHEITEVTSGFRWVLTYNLVHSDQSIKPLSAANTPDRILRAILNKWRKDINSGTCPHKELMYLLEHKYTDASLKFSALKGKDVVKAQSLKDVCDQTGFCLYLANLERTVFGGVDEDGGYGYRYGYDDDEDEDEDEDDYGYFGSGNRFHKIIDECDKTLKLTRIVDLTGKVVGTDFDIDDEDIIQEDPFEDRDPDKEDFEGYAGNEGANATHWYRNTALVLLPREHSVSFYLRPFHNGPRHGQRFGKPPQQLDELINRLCEELTQDPQNKRLQDELLGTCEFLTNHNINLEEMNKRDSHQQHAYGRWNLEKKERFPDSTLGLAVKASRLLQRLDLFQSATLAVEKHLPVNCFPDIGALLQTFGFSAVREGLSKAMNPISTIHERFEAIQKIQGSDSADDAQRITDSEFLKWAAEQLKEVLANQRDIHKKDGVALADLMSWEHGDSTWFETMVAMAKQHAANTPFAVSLLAAMPRADDTHKRAWREILSEMLQAFSLCHEPEPEQESKSNLEGPNDAWRAYHATYWPAMVAALPPRYGGSAASKVRKAPIDPKAMAELLRDCLIDGDLSTEAQTMLDKIISEAGRIDARDFHSMLLPFLKEVLLVLQAQEIPPTEPRFQSLYQSVISSYITRYVGKEPAPPRNWTRSRVRCGCSDCAWLNEFLVSPTERVGRFPMAKKRRQHLHIQLDSQGDYTHETERRGSPQTLVVTKTTKSFEESLNKWRKRVEEARQNISALGQGNLSALLGDRYDELTQLTAVRLSQSTAAASLARTLPPLQGLSSTQRPSGPAVARPLARSSGNVNPYAAAEEHCRRIRESLMGGSSRGTKRKAPPEFVDLTGED